MLQFAASPGSSPGVIAWQQTHLWSWIPGDRGEDIKTTQVSWLHATLKQNHDLAEGEEASSSSQVITDPDFNIRGHGLRKRRRTGTTVSTWYRWSGPGQSSEKTDQDFNRKYMLVNTACWHHEVRVDDGITQRQETVLSDTLDHIDFFTPQFVFFFSPISQLLS